MNKALTHVQHDTDFCVVGGGLAGMCAAISAARHGLKVVIMQDRPVFGGNASSEIRMWVCGARGKNNRETGIMEEIALEALYRNPYRIYPVWDTVLYEKVKQEKNITALLNCSCTDAQMDGNKIISVTGWQTTTQKWHTVSAKYFADCSGDSILAPLTGAEFRMGRESKDEFGESYAPDKADKKTMGMSCLIQARKMDSPRPFIAPDWAYKYTKEDLEPYHLPNIDNGKENFWYMELGGEYDSIGDTEELRDRLIKVALGIWDFVKNSGNSSAENWELEFLGFLPGKRESRRYVGDHILIQSDVESEGKFDDIIAYGGWSMDDHHPAGIDTKELPTIFHPAPSPFGIPYRCIYSKNIENLFFAGRNISVSHMALSSTRVMATCGVLGQAAGIAAAIACKYNLSPRQVYQQKINELKQTLMLDDCYLPFNKMEMSEITKNAQIKADCEFPDRLRSGVDRSREDDCVIIELGKEIIYDFGKPTEIKGIRFIFDSDLNRETVSEDNFLNDKTTICNIPLNLKPVCVPKTLVKQLSVYSFDDEKNEWTPLSAIENNHQRLVNLSVSAKCSALKFVPEQTQGSEKAHIFSINVD
ncbi:MAG: FAD-dependent oxidoreductase [Monoglobales bacterium]